MCRNATMVLFLLCCAALLSGCGGRTPAPITATELQVERIKIPDGLLTCAPIPGYRPVSSQADVAIVGGEAWAAIEDCRSKLAEIKRLQEEIRP